MVIKTSTSNGTSSFREQHSLQNFTYRNEEVTDKRFSSNLSAVPLSPLVPRSDSELCSWPTSSNFRQKNHAESIYQKSPLLASYQPQYLVNGHLGFTALVCLREQSSSQPSKHLPSRRLPLVVSRSPTLLLVIAPLVLVIFRAEPNLSPPLQNPLNKVFLTVFNNCWNIFLDCNIIY